MSVCNVNITTSSIMDILQKFLLASPVSVGFLAVVLAIFLLNILKKALVHYEQTRGKHDEKCKYLRNDEKSSYCALYSRKRWFVKHNNRCKGCRKWISPIPATEAETRVIDGSLWKSLIISIANAGKNILPYLSFVYALTIAIMGMS